MCRPPGGSSGGGGLSQTSQETKLEEGAWGETDRGGVVQACPQPMGLYWGLPKSLYTFQIWWENWWSTSTFWDPFSDILLGKPAGFWPQIQVKVDDFGVECGRGDHSLWTILAIGGEVPGAPAMKRWARICSWLHSFFWWFYGESKLMYNVFIPPNLWVFLWDSAILLLYVLVDIFQPNNWCWRNPNDLSTFFTCTGIVLYGIGFAPQNVECPGFPEKSGMTGEVQQQTTGIYLYDSVWFYMYI